MKREVPDEMLQDYLDGRLSAARRAEVEALLREDPEQAGRVEHWRAIGRALRESPEELAPGFYVRARERFEHATRKRSFAGFRILSWEAMGLAAAVALAAVLFVPEFMRPREQGDALSALDRTEIPEPTAGRAMPRKQADSKLEQAPGAPEETVATDDFAPAPEPELQHPSPAPTVTRAVPRGKGRASGRGDEAVGAARDDAAPPATEVAPPPADRESTVGRAEAVRADAPRTAAPQELEKRVSEAGERLAEPSAEAVGERAGVWAPEPTAVEAVALPSDAPVAEGLRIVDDLRDWEAWLRGPAGPALRTLGAPDENRRLVILGRTDGVDCESLWVRVEQGSYIVSLAKGKAPGCAFLLPRDGLVVTARPGAIE